MLLQSLLDKDQAQWPTTFSAHKKPCVESPTSAGKMSSQTWWKTLDCDLRELLVWVYNTWLQKSVVWAQYWRLCIFRQHSLEDEPEFDPYPGPGHLNLISCFPLLHVKTSLPWSIYKMCPSFIRKLTNHVAKKGWVRSSYRIQGSTVSTLPKVYLPSKSMSCLKWTGFFLSWIYTCTPHTIYLFIYIPLFSACKLKAACIIIKHITKNQASKTVNKQDISNKSILNWTHWLFLGFLQKNWFRKGHYKTSPLKTFCCAPQLIFVISLASCWRGWIFLLCFLLNQWPFSLLHISEWKRLPGWELPITRNKKEGT